MASRAGVASHLCTTSTAKPMWAWGWRSRSTGPADSRGQQVACAHDCGQIINPDGVRAQVEGSILQTISRVLMEEVMFDRSRVVSVDWASYPILRFSGVPKINIELINRPTEQPVGAGEAACTAVARRLPTRFMTQLALGCAPFRLCPSV